MDNTESTFNEPIPCCQFEMLELMGTNEVLVRFWPGQLWGRYASVHRLTRSRGRFAKLHRSYGVLHLLVKSPAFVNTSFLVKLVTVHIEVCVALFLEFC